MKLQCFEINSDAQALSILDRTHKFVINLGGKGSGKTATHPAWVIDREQFDTAQLHGIFTNTEKQLKDAVLPEIGKRIPYGTRWDYGRRPPKAWSRAWARENIRIPAVPDYRGIFYTSRGLHALCGTLFNQNYKQYESLEFGSLRLEEVPAISRIALTTIISRLRCGDRMHCAELGHRHQAHIYGNPPVGAHPWLFDFLDEWEQGAAMQYHALEDGETCDGCWHIEEDGDAVAKTHGPKLNHRQWPLLRRGVGPAILIKSTTADNRANLNKGFENDLARNFDKATALAWLKGEIVREVTGGCYAGDFSDANVRDVSYDPNRTLYVCVDINIEPRVAVLIHPLIAGEFPSEWAEPNKEQLGVFGEFFSLGGMSDHNFAEALCDGARGIGDAGYKDDRLRGLPENWKGLEAHKGPIIFYGDADGNRRSVHDKETGSSWEIMMRVFRRRLLREDGRTPRFTRDVPDNNPPARGRIHAVCAKLRNTNGKPSLLIAPRCRHALKDCESVVWNDDGLAEREWRQGPEMLRTHCMAAVGYCIHRRSPFGVDIDRDPKKILPVIGGSNIAVPKMRV